MVHIVKGWTSNKHVISQSDLRIQDSRLGRCFWKKKLEGNLSPSWKFIIVFFWYCSLHPGHMPLLRTKVKRVFVTQMKDTRVMKKEDFTMVTSRSLSCLESNFSCTYFPYWANSKTTCVLVYFQRGWIVEFFHHYVKPFI